MIKRTLQKTLLERARKLPLVAVIGPRQSGKTTLVRETFPKKKYVSLENPDQRLLVEQDPKGFLESLPDGAILDEVQKVPHLFSYLQTRVDETQKNGEFILTGSQNFLLQEKITQSLAGRISLLHLLPLSLEELQRSKKISNKYEDYLFSGMYPRVHSQKLEPHEWYPDYIQTYLERDVRQIKNISNLSSFQKFLKLCAGRTGQLLNLSSLGNECGISHNTAKEWISLLEASFIVFILKPYHNSFNKRIIKTPKLYFYDTGLACSLLGIKSAEEISSHYLRGGLFENFIISDLLKRNRNGGRNDEFYFWRDRTGNEVDCLLPTKTSKKYPLEIKSGKTISQDFFKGIDFWQNLQSGLQKTPAWIIYGGNEKVKNKGVFIVSWQELSQLKMW